MGGHKTSGFTIVELLMTLTVASVIMALAIPNFRDFIKNSRMSGASNDLLASLHLARTEAIKRRHSVAICPSANPGDDVPVCTASFNGNGWVVWDDTDTDKAIDAGEVVLGRHVALNSALTTFESTNVVAYQPSGFLGVNDTNFVLICDDRANAQLGNSYFKRVVAISKTGRASVRRTTDEMAGLSSELASQGLDPGDLNCP
jgi:type IV fimbrial biogenesis protein FimT